MTSSSELLDRCRGPGIGLGCQRLSEPDVERAQAFDVIAAALEAGIRLFDTADVYAPDDQSTGHNEILVREAIDHAGYDQESVVLATKCGLTRSSTRRPAGRWQPDGRAKALKSAAEASRQRLATDAIDLLQWHAPDPAVDPATSARALRALKDSAVALTLGACNLTRMQLEAVIEHAPIETFQVALSPFDLDSIKSGAVPFAIEKGLLVFAHSPLGGVRSRRKLSRSHVAQVAQRLDISPQQLTLAWIKSLSPQIVPLPGATTVEHVLANVEGCQFQLDEQTITELDRDAPAAMYLRRGRHAATPPAGEAVEKVVVLQVGFPAAGKTTYSRQLQQAGFVRLSRDERGGSLRHLLAPLEQKLTPLGATRDIKILLDATYPTRAVRFDVVDLARRLGARVECHWLSTPLEQAQVQAVLRLIERYGRLPEPEEIETLGRDDPTCFPPGAQFRYQKAFEAPREDEGFELVHLQPPRLDLRWGKRSALFLDEASLDQSRLDRLDELEHAYDDVISLSYRPRDRAHQPADEALENEIGRLAAVYRCTHPPGPSTCWCRKPLPGLGILAMQERHLDASRCAILPSSSADRTLANRLGWRVLEVVQ